MPYLPPKVVSIVQGCKACFHWHGERRPTCICVLNNSVKHIGILERIRAIDAKILQIVWQQRGLAQKRHIILAQIAQIMVW